METITVSDTEDLQSDEVFSDEFLVEEEIIEIISDMSEDEQKELGYTAEEFILSCQYSGYLCYPR